ncbi:hypothetical protein CEXT_447851 [Caerostris extrusa]|uniref:Uncharacterized protein n=1 Tax=Caerostris extrusa TaxID=172846 RepID=A0AAV4V9Q2_CAEEX|nr:hypothetical protein CEXT_447851 [Caerostris extrusa]
MTIIPTAHLGKPLCVIKENPEFVTTDSTTVVIGWLRGWTELIKPNKNIFHAFVNTIKTWGRLMTMNERNNTAFDVSGYPTIQSIYFADHFLIPHYHADTSLASMGQKPLAHFD